MCCQTVDDGMNDEGSYGVPSEMIEVYATTTPIDGPGFANEEGVVAKFVVFSQEFEHSRDTPQQNR